MWHYLYRLSDGTLMSETSQALQSVPDGCAVASFAERPSQTQMWDPAVRSFVAAAPAQVWTAKEFMQRFTLDEGAAILEAAKTDSVVAYLLAVIQSPGDVHSDNPLLAQGLSYLVARGRLTAERAAEIVS